MKRFAFWFIAGLIAVSMVKSASRHHPGSPPRPRHAEESRVIVHRSSTGEGRGQAVYVIQNGDRQIVTIDEEGVHLIGEGAEEQAAGARHEPELQPAEGLPVPVVPGSRVTVARAEPPAPPQPPRVAKSLRAIRTSRKPPAPPRPPAPPQPPAPPEPKIEPVVVAGQLSATEERAKKDAHEQLLTRIHEWLAPDVPRDWTVPERLIIGMIQETKVVPVERDYGTLYQATLLVDGSPRAKAEVAKAYRHEQISMRLFTLGGLLAFVLVCLATLSGYIRADEATKGYYTNRLRLAAAAGVGAAGVVAYRMLT